MTRLDPHSYADSDQPQLTELDWRARVDFAARSLECEAILALVEPGRGPLDLDTRDLAIEAVVDEEGRALPFELHPPEPILGARLRIELPAAGLRRLRIRYRTAPQASALQWLEPAQTAGGKQPFLFSQCQAIHARSIIPVQDTPRVRLRYRAALTVPAELRALMAAAFVSREVEGGEAVERFAMPQPIPPYLFALAVGELASRDLGPRSRVWAEPSVLERAAWEFAEVDRMLACAEAMFGPYDWDRFDLLTMPPAFPYGGMENPRLTFLTPALLAGDRSLVSVVAHELAHSWTGNLVTNASAEHFWLNEGMTVFAERRIVAALEGEDASALQAAIGRLELEDAIDRFAERPVLTRLRVPLEGIDPDETFSIVPYEKGYLFLRALEAAAGREAFDRFLRAYVAAFRFTSITTDDFLALAERELPGALERIRAKEWIDGPGLPSDAPQERSVRLEAIRALGAGLPSDEQAGAFTPVEWQLYLDAMPRPAPTATLDALEARFQLTGRENLEVLAAWLTLALESGYPPVLPRVEALLAQVGRMKYLKPLYRALAANPQTRELARRCFAANRRAYHPIAQQVVEGLLAAGGSE